MVSRLYKHVKDGRFWSVSHSRRRYIKPVFTSFPLQRCGYRTVAADLHLQAFLSGYPGIELLNVLGGIIEKSGNPRPSVIDSVKIRFLLTHCTWQKWASSPFHPENTYDFKDLLVGSTICFFAFFNFLKKKIVDPTPSRIHDRRARVNVNATHVKKKKQFSKTLIEKQSRTIRVLQWYSSIRW